MRATNEASVDGDPDEEEDDESETWAKALKTELMLREELAMHKRLPKDIWKIRSLRNLIKLLLRVKKLFGARSSAINILRSLMAFKNASRGQVENTQGLFKQAIFMRTSLLEFRSDYKIFGTEFMYEDIDLYLAFDAI